MGRRLAVTAAAGLLAVAGAAVAIVGSSASSATSIMVSPQGNDASCAPGGPACVSLNRAYQVVSSGGTISVADGSYGYQKILYDSSKSSDPVIIRPQTGAQPTFGTIDLGQDQTGDKGPSHLIVDRLTVAQWRAWSTVDDLQVINTVGKNFEIDGASNVKVLGGSYGGCDQAKQGCINFVQGNTIEVRSVEFHNATSSDLNCCHVDAMFVRGVNGLTLDGNWFHSNQITNIRLQDCCGLTPNQNVTVKGNWFGTVYNDQALSSAREDAVDFDTPISNLTVTGNVFQPGSGPLFEPGAGNGAVLSSNDFRYVGPCSAASYQGNTTAIDSPGWGDTLCGSDKWGSWGWNPALATVADPAGGTTTTTPTTTAATTTVATTTTTASGPLSLKVVSRTTSKITLGWTPYPGLGYEFLKDGARVSNTWDPSRSQVTFGYTAGSLYTVRAVGNAAEESLKG